LHFEYTFGLTPKNQGTLQNLKCKRIPSLSFKTPSNIINRIELYISEVTVVIDNEINALPKSQLNAVSKTGRLTNAAISFPAKIENRERRNFEMRVFLP
jgi:hypothetical protein